MYHLIPSSTNLYWPSTSQYRHILTQYHQVPLIIHHLVRHSSVNWIISLFTTHLMSHAQYTWSSFTLPFDGMFPVSGNVISDNWSGPRDCSRFKQKCPIFLSGYQIAEMPPDGYDYTQCVNDEVFGDKKIMLQRSLEARIFEDPCQFCTERGEVCGYEVSL